MIIFPHKMLPNGEKLIFIWKGQPRKMRLVAQFWKSLPTSHLIPAEGNLRKGCLFVRTNVQFAYEIAIHSPSAFMCCTTKSIS